MNLKKQKGFTLIELMIVVAIIGILASIAIPQFAQFRIKAFNSAGAADLRNGSTSIEAFYSDVYTYPNTAATVVQGAGSVLLTATVGAKETSLYWNISDGVGANYTKGASAGWCARAKHIGGNTIYIASDNAAAPVPLDAAAAEGIAFGGTGATQATDCSENNAATIKALTIS